MRRSLAAMLPLVLALAVSARAEEPVTLKAHSKDVLCVALSPDGKLLASGSKDATIKLWDVAERKELAALAGHSGPVQSVAFSPDGALLCSGEMYGQVKVWDVAARKEVATLKHETSVHAVCFSPD